MINLAIAIGAMLAVVLGFSLLQVHLAFAIPLGLMVGMVAFFILGRRVQDKLQDIMIHMIVRFRSHTTAASPMLANAAALSRSNSLSVRSCSLTLNSSK